MLMLMSLLIVVMMRRKRHADGRDILGSLLR